MIVSRKGQAHGRSCQSQAVEYQQQHLNTDQSRQLAAPKLWCAMFEKSGGDVRTRNDQERPGTTRRQAAGGRRQAADGRR